MHPLTLSDYNGLIIPFFPFEGQPVVAVAVSGGPDSLALALLAHQWATSQGGKAIALTVDHQLRPSSAEEAQQVKAWLQARGMEHHILVWNREKEKATLETAIQASARQARYGLLGQWCKAQGVKHLLTAHHAQDQVETFMIRLAKGSGLKGLTGIQKEVATDFGRILRPLLMVEPERLKITLKQLNQPYLSDPSNENVNFTRIRWRQLLPALAREGLTPQSIQETGERLTHAQRLIDQYISALIHRYVVLSPYGYARLMKEACQEPCEAFEEILKRLLATVGTREYPVRRQALQHAINRVKAGRSVTLGGCQVLCKPNGWWVVRELSAIKDGIFVSQAGAYRWDDRFMVVVKDNSPRHIAALGERGTQSLDSLAKAHFKEVPSIVLKTLPALWHEGQVREALPSITFTPRYPL